MTWLLNKSGEYTVASSRNLIDSRLLPKGELKTRWIRYVPIKVNTLAWKVKATAYVEGENEKCEIEWLIYSTWFVGDNLSSLMQSVGASEKVFQMMDFAPRSKLPSLKGRIEFRNVSFSYSSRETAHVLKDINIAVDPYEVVALVGLSGSGKSTIVNLLLRLYEPTSGQILIDGSPLKDLDIKWLRERIGYVGQEPKLFRMDVSSNIAYGCTGDVSQEDIEQAAKQAYAHDFIVSLPDGYKTIVDDDLLSGGQKQRIAIARALLRKPSILVLDEATSALDAESEYNIKGVLSAAGDNFKRTVIIIAHRLSTVQAADRIVVMDRGQVIEMGNHRELLLKDGLYARLTRRQVDAVG
ncbi:ABC transporter B family member 26, chloroplastic [Tanacetum coccineum]